MNGDSQVSTRAWRCRGTSALGARCWLGLSVAILVTFPGLPARADPCAAGPNPLTQLQTTGPTDGSISGTVKGPSSAAVLGTKLTLRVDGTNSSQTAMTAVTDAKGKFLFAALPPGTYTIEVEAASFQESTRSHLVVDGHKHLVVDFSLVPDGPGVKAPRESGAPPETAKTPSDSPLGGFNYYDRAEFKSGEVSGPVDPGGYSAAKEVDSYHLLLDYIQSEGVADTRLANGQARAGSELPPTAPELNSWSENQFLSRGSDLLFSHDVTASIDTFQAGVTRFPNSAKLATGLGVAFLTRGEFGKAIDSLLRATDLAPSDPRPYFVLAEAFSGSPTPSDEVSKRLERLVALDPHDPQACYWYALALGKTHSTDGAILRRVESLLQSAVTLDPNFAEAHLQLGILYAARSNYSEAIREYQSAIRLKPTLAAAHYRLAQAYRQTGDNAAAQVELDLYERLRKLPTSSH